MPFAFSFLLAIINPLNFKLLKQVALGSSILLFILFSYIILKLIVFLYISNNK